MPDDALPVPPTPFAGDLVRLYRSYADVLGRPMTGRISFTGTKTTVNGGSVTLPATVTVELEDGKVDIRLPADTYQVHAMLRTVDRDTVFHDDTITLEN